MGAVAIAFPQEEFNDKYYEMTEYLSSEGGYWLREDKWMTESEAFSESGLKTGKRKRGILADFSGYQNHLMKVEMKYYLLFVMKEGILSPFNVMNLMTTVIRLIGSLLGSGEHLSFEGLKTNDAELADMEMTECVRKKYRHLKSRVVGFITDYYDDREEFLKDVWYAARIPGAKQSASDKGVGRQSISFTEFRESYRMMIKRYMSRLVIRRSWSHCSEMLLYLKYFFRVFYAHGYEDGFFERLSRNDIEKYLCWVAEDYADKNATFRSKAVSFVRQFIDYIQLSEYKQSPQKDVNRLIFDDDIPKRERPEDTISKVKYIPAPVLEILDSNINELEPKEMRPLYILLRESGWRATDILNLRYNDCLNYYWIGPEQKYVPYMCGEITKTGIPSHKIPIRQEVADILKNLKNEAESLSTDLNNPDKYLFNIYNGGNKGRPYSRRAFSKSVQDLINKKGITDGAGEIYHFKAHSLRHTRALEYTEQGMPIGVVQQILGHLSLQMTLHYAKVSENVLYGKWRDTEKLDLLHLDAKPPRKKAVLDKGLHYDLVKKNLDAVKVPLGMCFKPSKLNCRHQANSCLECANFCSSGDDISEYEAQIEGVKKLLELSKRLGRDDWAEKNREYLEILEKMLFRIQAEGIVHKNGNLREESND